MRAPSLAQAVQQIEQRIGTFVEALVETVPNSFESFASFDIVQSPFLCSLYKYRKLNDFFMAQRRFVQSPIDNNPLILEELKKYIFRTSDKLERTHQSIKSLLSREQELAAICESHVSVDACEKLFEAVADCSEVGDSRLCNLAATAGNEFAITQVTLQFHRAAGENSVKGREQIND